MVPALTAKAQAISQGVRRALPDLLLVGVVVAFGLWRLRALVGCEYACLQDYSRDLPYEFYTIHAFARQALDQGSFPFWDPHIMAGHPVGAQFGNSLLYPPLWIWLLLAGPGTYTPRAEELLLVVHLVGAGAAIYASARLLGFGRVGALVAGLIYAGMPQSFPMLQWPPMIFGIPWVPLTLAAWLRLMDSPRPSQAVGLLWLLGLSGALLLMTAHPNLPAYTWLSMALAAGMALLRDAITRRRGPRLLLRHALELGLAAVLPVVLAALFVVPLLLDLPHLARYVLPFHGTMGYLVPELAWDLLFPGSAEVGLVRFGTLALGLALGASLLVDHPRSKAWTLAPLAGFWLLYLLEGSPVFAVLRPLPLMGTLRYSTRAVVVVAMLLALLAGAAAGAITRGEPRTSRRPGLGLVLLASVAATLIWAWRAAPVSAEQLAASGYHGPWLLALGLLAIPFLLWVSHGPRRKLAFAGVVLLAIGAFFELDRWAPMDLASEEAGPLEPHASLVATARERFPEVFAQPSLDRHMDWGHHNTVPYWTGTYATSGLTWPWFRTAYTASPANYYSLWSDDWPGTKESLYTKRSPSLDAGLYDLLGVRWFLFSDHREWVHLGRRPGYYDKVEDEFLLLTLSEPGQVGALSAELNCDFVDDVRGRIRLEVDDAVEGEPVEAQSGDSLEWVLAARPVQRLRLVMERRGMYALPDGPRDLALGCSIGRLVLSDGKDGQLDLADLEIKSSSGVADPGLLASGDPSQGWRPDLGLEIDAILTQGQVRKVHDSLYENLDVLPRGLMVYRWEVSTDPEASWAQLRSDTFDPQALAWFEQDPGLPPPPEAPGNGAVELTRYEPNLLELSVSTDRPGLLLLGELAAPGWRAWVDGRRTPVLTADGAFRAVYQEPGQHQVRLRYRPPGMGWGVLISLLSLLALAVWTWMQRRRTVPHA